MSRKWFSLVSLLSIFGLMMMSLSARTAMAVHGIGVFELDGNANVDPNAVEPNDVTPGEDWNLVVPTKDPSSAALAKAFAGENVEALGNDANYFTGGGSKDTNDVSQWKYGGNAVPDKNQITNAYAAAYSSGGKLYIYFGADRYSNDGDSALGFWLFKSTVSLGANGSFNGNHTDGDLFIVSDFSNGGTIGTISVYRWNGGANGSLGSTASATGADCRNATGDHLVCARVNGSSVTDHRAPWPYTPKPNIGTPGTFPLLTFFEGGLDVTALAGPDACFSSFLAETRSSTSTTAQLKDFALAQLNTCDARISINPSGVNPVGQPHPFTIFAEKSTGAGFVPASGVLATATIAPGSVGSFVNNVNTCTTGTDGKCTVSVNSSVAGTVTVNASAKITVGGSELTRSTDGTGGNSGPAVKHYVDASVAISPPAAVNAVGQPHTFTINATAYKAGATVSSWSIVPTITPAPASAPVSTCASPTISGDTASCTVTINSSSAGTFTADATATVDFSLTGGTPASAQVVRSTSGNSGPGGSGSAVKHYVDATITISPDDTNNLGEQHVFNILVTASKAGATVSSYAITTGVSPTPGTISNTCASPTIVNDTASCSITINSNVAGTFVANASATVNFNITTPGANPSTASVTRDTDPATANIGPGPGGSGSATKVYKDGTLIWHKVDQDGAPLGGATFTVCQTDKLVSSDGSYTDVNPDACVDVLDNDSRDVDKADGEFKLVGLILGKYSVTEKTAPAGYTKDTSTKLAQHTMAATNAEITVAFVNTKLFKLIVLTCNQSTNELVKSTVTLDTNGAAEGGQVTLDTLDASTIAGLCDLGGANFGNLRQGTYGPSVVLPKQQPQ